MDRRDRPGRTSAGGRVAALRITQPIALALACTAAGCGGFVARELGGAAVEEAAFSLFHVSDNDHPECDTPPNRCGPIGVFTVVVPDCPGGVVCFNTACNRHDICYGRCGSVRADCDAAFLRNLMLTCAGDALIGDPRVDECLSLAYIYWQAVARFGQIPFEIAQSFDCACRGIPFEPSFDLKPPFAPRRSFHPFPDADDDLMPDDWENLFGLDPHDPSDAFEDDDADGVRNLEEFINGTDPQECDDPVTHPALLDEPGR